MRQGVTGIFLFVQRKLVNVLQQITSDIHALIHLIWNKSFKSKTNRQDFVETRVTHIFWTHWKACQTRTGPWHLHPYANTNTSRRICIRDYKHRNTWCNPGPQTANTRLRQSLDNTNVINVWRLSTTAPDTQHRQILIKVQIYKTTLYQDDTGPTWSMGRKRKERHWGGAIQMHIQRDRRQSTHALVWTLTYLHLNFNGSKFFRSHSWKLQRMEIWREDLKLRNLFPPEF